MTATDTYYIKLGTGGRWAEESIKRSIVRVGWSRVPLDLIHKRDWVTIDKIERPLSKSPGAATSDLRALQRFVLSKPDDIWITFHDSRMWWGRLGEGEVAEDDTSKYRVVVGGWSDKSATGSTLLINQLPGCLAQLQGFRGTICKVHADEVLRRVLSATPSPEFEAVRLARNTLAAEVEKAIRLLHWKDFELLVDLVFRQSGWRRTSLLGETMKSVDLELEDTVAGDKYQVQVKSRADEAVLRDCEAEFCAESFRRFYLVVHTPEGGLETAVTPRDADVQLVKVDRLATMVVDAGLTGWLLDKIR
jgi:hypothetical protein